MDWKEELRKILENRYTDSDIEDFAIEHPNVDGKDIWDFVFEYIAPGVCKGCKHIQRANMMPCIRCSRKVKVKDYFEARR